MVSPEIIGFICLILLLILMYSRMWIGLVMLFVGFWGLVFIMGLQPALTALATVPYRNVGNYTFAAIPLFLLMGSVIFNTGFASDLFYSVYTWMGRLRGGLAMATSLAAAILGVVTDSMVAVITLGKVAIPEMKKHNYDDAFATGSILGGAALASLIPPSIGFILYGMLTQTSIGKLYMAAVVPGIVFAILIMLMIGVMATINRSLAPAGPKTSFKEKFLSLKYTWAMLLIFVVIIFGIYLGIFTPTEAGAIGAAFSFIVGFVARRLNRKSVIGSIIETAQTTAMIVLLMVGAYVFMTMMTASRLPFALADFIVGLELPVYLIVFVIALIYIIFGMFCDIIACIILTVPIIFPMIKALGIDPIWFGVLIVILIEIGFISPPLGFNSFILSSLTKIQLNVVFRGTIPFIALFIIFIVLIYLFPQIVLFLPGTM